MSSSRWSRLWARFSSGCKKRDICRRCGSSLLASRLGAVLVRIGLVMIYSASSITAMAVEGNSYNYLIRQLAFIIAGG